jgi:iron complex transport system permease protein
MKLRRMMTILLPLLLSVIVAGLCFGSAPLSVSQLLAALTGTGAESIRLILLQIRLPRVLAGCLAGVGLSTAGVLLQTVTANDLASPNVIGINYGAGLAVILTLTFAPKAGWLLPLGAFLGAMGAAMVILLAGSRIGSSRSSVVLIGIAVTTLCNAVISLLSLLDEGILAQYNHFTVGSLRDVRLGSLIAPGILILAGFCLALGLAGRLGVLSLGDEAAAALGIRVKRLRLAALACAAACAAAVVSFAGLLGFVGLIVPHVARRLVWENPRRMLPVAALSGACLLVLADLLGRVLVAPSELPVGILMSLIGAPYFLILLAGRNRHA